MKKPRRCKHCDGTGRVTLTDTYNDLGRVSSTCPVCWGTGKQHAQPPAADQEQKGDVDLCLSCTTNPYKCPMNPAGPTRSCIRYHKKDEQKDAMQ